MGSTVSLARRRSWDVLNDHSDQFVRAIATRLDELTDRATEAILAEIPAYRELSSGLLDDVRAHVGGQFRTAIATFEKRRKVSKDDLEFSRTPASRRVGHVSLADFQHAFRIGEGILWDAARELAENESMQPVVLDFATHLMQSGGFSSGVAAQHYAEAERMVEVTGERIRRDLLEDLLAGRELRPGPRTEAARAAGLEDGRELVVITAGVSGGGDDDPELRAAATAVASTMSSAVYPPLTVIRHREVVAVAQLRDEELIATVERLGTMAESRSKPEAALSIGVSTLHTGVASVSAAYAEASFARKFVAAQGGMVALPALGVFEFLAMQSDQTARRLIPPKVKHFLAEDAAHGGGLISTLQVFVDSNLSVKETAERLHLHVNTARYRLAKISETTDCDLRRVQDLMNLLLAVRLWADPESQPGPGRPLP